MKPTKYMMLVTDESGSQLGGYNNPSILRIDYFEASKFGVARCFIINDKSMTLNYNEISINDVKEES